MSEQNGINSIKIISRWLLRLFELFYLFYQRQ
jgi:hypothetical protein